LVFASELADERHGVIPAKAGIQIDFSYWIPAFAGMTSCFLIYPGRISSLTALFQIRFPMMGSFIKTLLSRVFILIRACAGLAMISIW
jgi:hypothetical protein